MIDSAGLVIILLAALLAFFCRVWGFKDGYQHCWNRLIGVYGDKWVMSYDEKPKKNVLCITRGVHWVSRDGYKFASWNGNNWIDQKGKDINVKYLSMWSYLPRKNIAK